MWQEKYEALEQHIAELEANELKLIAERDNAEDVVSLMYEAATGKRPEWSNCFGFADAIEEVAQMCGRQESWHG